MIETQVFNVSINNTMREIECTRCVHENGKTSHWHSVREVALAKHKTGKKLWPTRITVFQRKGKWQVNAWERINGRLAYVTTWNVPELDAYKSNHLSEVNSQRNSHNVELR